MEITVTNQQKKVSFEHRWEKIIEEVMHTGLAEHGLEKAALEVGVLLVDDGEIARLNREYRGIDKSTDVLSFPQYQDLNQLKMECEKSLHNLLLGDIVISLETCLEQALEYGHSAERELGFLTVHGILHLLGYNHIEPEDEEKMREEEEYILKKINLGR